MDTEALRNELNWRVQFRLPLWKTTAVSLASERLSTLLREEPHPPAEQPSPFDASRLLVKIVRDVLERNNPDRVVIPLSDGLDSRALLGAVLQLAPPRDILTVTYGDPDRFAPSVRVKELTRRLKIEWTPIDPNRTHFDMDAAVAARLNNRSSFEPLFGGDLLRFLNREIDGLLGSRDICLSGFLGGALSGAHVRHSRYGSAAVERFVRTHTEAPELEDGLQALLTRTASDFLNRERKERPSGFSDLDVLYLAFRQLLWIRSVMADIRSCFAPFEDSRWVDMWQFLPHSARHEQAFYRTMLSDTFPLIFSLPRDKVDGKAKPRARGRTTRVLQRMRREPSPRAQGTGEAEHFLERGDPRRNASLAALLEESMRSIDATVEPYGEAFIDRYRRALMTRDRTDWKVVLAGLSFELDRRMQSTAGH